MTWKKGESGNPGGKPHRADIKLLCRRGSRNAVRLLRQVVEGKIEAPIGDRIRAAQYILDRVEPRPTAEQGSLFQGATIVVDTGIRRDLPAPTIDVSPTSSMNGHDRGLEDE